MSKKKRRGLRSYKNEAWHYYLLYQSTRTSVGVVRDFQHVLTDYRNGKIAHEHLPVDLGALLQRTGVAIAEHDKYLRRAGVTDDRPWFTGSAYDDREPDTGVEDK